jgi:CRP/FNR family transcriptional regulator, cyclic AMP receptor protein
MTALLLPEEWSWLESNGRTHSYRKGEVLFREGARGTSVLALREGRVKVTVAAPSGREVLLVVKEPGQLLGELSALDGRPRSATATALEPVRAVALPASSFETFLEAHPRLGLRLLRSLASQLRDAAQLTADRDGGDTSVRVARRLLSLADRFGEHCGAAVDVTLGLTQDDLAGWVGATREATSRALSRFREEGLLTTARQRVTIHDVEGLRRLVEAV